MVAFQVHKDSLFGTITAIWYHWWFISWNNPLHEARLVNAFNNTVAVLLICRSDSQSI